MSNPLEAMDERPELEKAQRKREKANDDRMRKDVQTLFETPEARRAMFAFLTTCGIDLSPLRNTPQVTAHAIGWQDAGGWWLNQIRAYCPEREAQMRAEARKQVRHDAPISPEDEEP